MITSGISVRHTGLSKRETLARIVGNQPVARLIRHLARAPGIVCVTHHRIAEDVQHDSDVISATPAQLDLQIQWLHESFMLLSGDQVCDVITARNRLHTSAVAITFDDAYEDNFAAGQLLHRRGIAATFFVPTGFIETGVIPPWDRLGYAVKNTHSRMLTIPLDDGPDLVVSRDDYGTAMTQLMGMYSRLSPAAQAGFIETVEDIAGVRAADSTAPLFMTWEQIRCLREMGHTIGGHTHTHPVLARLTPDAQREEIRTSKQILDQRLGQTTMVFAYPYGKPERSFSAVTKQIVRECGYEAAFSFYGGWNRDRHPDPFDVRRMKVDPGTSIWRFRARVASRGAIPV